MTRLVFVLLLLTGCHPKAGDVYRNPDTQVAIELVNVGACQDIFEMAEWMNSAVLEDDIGIEALYSRADDKCFSYSFSDVFEDTMTDTIITYIRPVSDLEGWQLID